MENQPNLMNTPENLTDYQVQVLKGQLKEHGQCRLDSLRDAGYLASKLKLTNKTHTVIKDCREGEGIFIETKESASMLRGFEVEYSISEVIAKAKGGAA